MADDKAATKLQAASRGRSARSQKQPDWQDTNMALFGSDIEKKCKAAAADGEPQWTHAGTKVGMEIWRIEQFKVKDWPASKYGQFHTGDSYIILHTYVKDPTVNPDKLAWDVHFWIGAGSTQDEYGTAAYKTVELDDKLGGSAVQHREVEGDESDLFCGYFPTGLRYLKGGVKSGFTHVETKGEEREPVLLQVKGSPPDFVLRQVRLKRTYMNSGDVFLMDLHDALYIWNGASASPHEKSKAREVAKLLQQDYAAVKYREIRVLDEGTGAEGDGAGKEYKYRSSHPFWRHLPGERRMLGVKLGSISIKDAAKGGDDGAVKAFAPALFYISAKSDGPPLFRAVCKGRLPPISKLRHDRVCLFDDGFQCVPEGGMHACSVRACMHAEARSRPPP